MTTRSMYGDDADACYADTEPAPAPELPEIKLVRAKHYKRLDTPRTAIDYIVIHSAESSERPTSAEGIANYFTNPIQKRGDRLVEVKASAHYSVDSDSIVQSVPEGDVAWHVRTRGFNDRTIGVELAGKARQTREQWLDDFGNAMLPLASRLVARLCRRWAIPLRHVRGRALESNLRGIVGHVDLTNHFGRPETHTDPGEGFPWDVFLDLIDAAAAEWY